MTGPTRAVPALPNNELLTFGPLETTLETTPETTRGPPPEALEPSPEAPSTHGDDFGADPRGVTVNQIVLEKTTHSR